MDDKLASRSQIAEWLVSNFAISRPIDDIAGILRSAADQLENLGKVDVLSIVGSPDERKEDGERFNLTVYLALLDED